jgi:hypothetical protein
MPAAKVLRVCLFVDRLELLVTANPALYAFDVTDSFHKLVAAFWCVAGLAGVLVFPTRRIYVLATTEQVAEDFKFPLVGYRLGARTARLGLGVAT